AARFPERVGEWIVRKQEQLADPEFVDFYLALGEALDRGDDDPRLVELADRVAAYITRLADERGEEYVGDAGVEPALAALMDTLAFDTVSSARRLIELLEQRGWAGWTRLERVEPT
ncbi:MerR family transcriptional regulator, partial [Streptomyces sp. NPDC006386]